MALTPAEYDRINMPILTITGHYDDDQPGAMEYYKRHMASASPSRDQHYMIIGPWDHPGTRTPKKEHGGLTFGDASLLDLNKLHTEWYDWTMKGGAKPEFLKARVAYYLAGADEWKYADSLEAISNSTRRLYLGSNGGKLDAFHSGSLSEAAPGQSSPDSYTYDPLDTRREELEREPVANYYTDQRYVLHADGDGLVYHSAPFEAAVEVTGKLKLVVWLALDVPDTDFQVTVYEILADGSSIQLAQDLLRARYRESLREPKLVEAGAILPYTFDGFMFFSRRIAKGSRLRLFFTSPNSIYFQKNYNGGGVVAEESGADARTAHVTLYHDAEHPSYLELPIVN
jgi:putative CocE/NonD family hydrolase